MPHGIQGGGDAVSAENDWAWPPSMDAVVAAPESHRVLFENDDVRVLEVTIAAGHREPEHTHRDPSVMIVDDPARIRYYRGDTLTLFLARGHRGVRDAGELDGPRGSPFGRECR
jgi:hypothetical protein